MGIKKWVLTQAQRASNVVSDLSTLSPGQLDDIEYAREMYLSQMPDMNSEQITEFTNRLLAAASIDIYNAYLPQLDELYLPVKEILEFEKEFNVHYNVRYINITKWVTDKKENNLEKLINVYQVLSNENCNIALVFNRTMEKTNVYLGISNMNNRNDNSEVDIYMKRISDAIKGNFPGAEYKSVQRGVMRCLDNDDDYSVASVSNIPTEKSKEFISQTIEKLLDGIVPDELDKEYTIILLATPITDVEERKIKLGEFYSALNPYSSWQTNYTYVNSEGIGSSATVGLNVGASAGIQRGTNSATTTSDANTTNENDTVTDNTSTSTTHTDSTSKADTTGVTNTDTITESKNTTKTDTVSISANESVSTSVGINIPFLKEEASATVGLSEGYSHAKSVQKGKSVSKAVANQLSNTVTNGVSDAVANTVGQSVAKTLGKAVTKTVGKTVGIARSANLGANFGANFARSSNVNVTVGSNQGITQNYVNYNIKHTLDIIEKQMERYEKSTSLGMWDFAGYVLSEDQTVANNVAHSYLALTQGEESYLSQASINLWRGDTERTKESAKEICKYLRDLRHPIFGLKPNMVLDQLNYLVYPTVVTATTSLSGQELAKSLNFPRKSISGLPVIECAEFGRNINTYDFIQNDSNIRLGNIFHMNHEENVEVELNKQSLASHTFITGSTGSGKSNTVYKLLDEAMCQEVKFLVVEPTKGEYKTVFGNKKDVHVYGTNPSLMPLLKINPFSFPKNIHVYEHMDRLVEIFNACWPMYAAMPAVLKNAIEKSYVDCGWDLNDSYNPYGEDLYPSFKDVVRNIKSIIDSSEYDNENKGAYKGSLITRLTSLCNGINGLIFTNNEISSKELFDENVIIDLSRVGSAETKSLLMGMIVLKLQEYRMSESDEFNSKLKHITVLEEAHNLLKRTSSEVSSESSNLIGKSVEMISNSIAEMRTYGEGFIIVDQAPGLLDMSAIRNTNTKIIMRLPDFEDRALVGKAANLNEDQINELVKLPMGVGAIYQNNWIQPVLCKIDKYIYEKQKYYYDRLKSNNDRYDYSISLKIADMISSQTAVNKAQLDDVKEKLHMLNIDASTKVKILKFLKNPPKQFQMTKLAPIFHELFPYESKLISDAIDGSKKSSDWTIEAIESINNHAYQFLSKQTRIDIIHSLVTYQLYIVRNDANSLKLWREGRYFS